MPIERTIKLYQFDELDDRAKERARDWYRGEDCGLSYDWWDSTYEDFCQICEILGIDLNTKPVKLMNGSTRQEPQIYFSGFCRQGDGACFAGTFYGKLDMVEKIKEYAPLDTDLHNIAESLFVDFVQPYNATCRVDITTRGNYCHSGTMSVEFCEYEDSEGEWYEMDNQERQDIVKNNLRWLADWLHRTLEKEYEWLTADEQIDESIRSNEYTFLENGTRHE